jgi:hypothetical protein
MTLLRCPVTQQIGCVGVHTREMTMMPFIKAQLRRRDVATMA